MKIVVIGGTGLIGSKVVDLLREQGHEVIAAAPANGVNTVTGEGLAGALEGAQVVVDVSNSPSLDEREAMDFFQTAGRNIVEAEKAAGVSHHVALSVVGTDRLQASGYFRAKLAQERQIQSSPIPYTLVRATQFFEFIRAIAQSGDQDGTIHLPPAEFQPMAARDIAGFVAQAALSQPLNSMIEIGGPQKYRMNEIAERVLAFDKDPRPVVADPSAPYFGLQVDDRSLVPGPDARLGETAFDWWLENVPPPPQPAAAMPAVPVRA